MRNSIRHLGAVLVVLSAGLAGAALAAEVPEPRTITVTGIGKIAAKPDIAVIATGVTAQAPSAAEAMRQNTQRMAALFAALKAAGVAERDIRTSGLSLQPVYGRQNSGTLNSPPHPPKVVAFRASNQVSVRFRDLPNVGAVLDTLISAGANQINGIQFVVSDADNKRDLARSTATADAKRKAEIYLLGVGARLGKVLSIHEAGGFAPPRGPVMARAMAMESTAVPISPGEQQLSVSVTVVFEVE